MIYGFYVFLFNSTIGVIYCYDSVGRLEHRYSTQPLEDSTIYARWNFLFA